MNIFRKKILPIMVFLTAIFLLSMAGRVYILNKDIDTDFVLFLLTRISIIAMLGLFTSWVFSFLNHRGK